MAHQNPFVATVTALRNGTFHYVRHLAPALQLPQNFDGLDIASQEIAVLTAGLCLDDQRLRQRAIECGRVLIATRTSGRQDDLELLIAPFGLGFSTATDSHYIEHVLALAPELAGETTD